MPSRTAKAERRQQILEAAMACFARKGYHLTTMDNIAAELPFSKGLLYYYFETKRDLFLAILDNWMDAATAAWKIMFPPGENATTQLRTGLEYGLQLLVQHVDLARVEFEFYGELGRDAEISKAFQAFFVECRAQFVTILEAGITSGEFRPVNVEALAAVLLGIYEGLAMQVMVAPEAFDWPVIASEMFEMVMRGISLTAKE